MNDQIIVSNSTALVEVWIIEMLDWGGRADIYGVYSSPEAAMAAYPGEWEKLDGEETWEIPSRGPIMHLSAHEVKT